MSINNIQNTFDSMSQIRSENFIGFKGLFSFFNPFRIFLLAIIILTMYNNLEHSASVYLSIASNPDYSDWYNRFQSYLVVIVIDLAVIAFIISSKNKESEIFAWVLFVTNCLFFNVFQSGFDIFNACINYQTSEPLPSLVIQQINGLIAKIVFSGLFSYCIHRFSFLWFERTQSEFLQQKQENIPKFQLKDEQKRLEEALNQLQYNHIEILEELRDRIQENNILEDEIVALKSRLKKKKSDLAKKKTRESVNNLSDLKSNI